MIGLTHMDSRNLCSERQSFGYTGHTDVQPERTGFNLEHKSVRVPHGSGVQLHQPQQGKCMQFTEYHQHILCAAYAYKGRP